MKVKELIAKLQEMDQDGDVQVEVWSGCHGPESWYKGVDVGNAYNDKDVMLSVDNGCVCQKGNRLKPDEAIQQNSEMKKAFFKLRKDAFLSRLDRTELLELAVKFVGNQAHETKD